MRVPMGIDVRINVQFPIVKFTLRLVDKGSFLAYTFYRVYSLQIPYGDSNGAKFVRL